MRITLLLFVALIAVSCNNKTDTTQPESELLLVDKAFSDFSAENGFKAAFAKYCAEDGVILRPGSLPIIGRDAVIKNQQGSDDSEMVLTWEPQFARAAQSGELGYTYGTYSINSASGSQLGEGTYVSIWEKGEDGWKFLLDTGNEGLGQ